jgi:hypothetical protein
VLVLHKLRGAPQAFSPDVRASFCAKKLQAE